MTDEMMDLCAFLEKASDADIVREMLAFGAKRLMELEAGAKTGAAFGEKSAMLDEDDEDLAQVPAGALMVMKILAD
jgi:hypothetical protein